MIEAYWKLLFTIFILTGIGYFYLMRIKMRYFKLHKNAPLWLKIVLIPQVVVFLFLDWSLNLLLTIPMLGFPSKPFELTTGRMKRYRKLNELSKIVELDRMDKIRLGFANWMCAQLNRGEKGHC